MKDHIVDAGKAAHASGQNPDDLRALEQIVEIVRRIDGGADNLGLEEKVGEIKSGCLFVLKADRVEWRFEKALALADILKKGSREAKGFAAGICKALQREFPFVADIPVEPAQGVACPNAAMRDIPPPHEKKNAPEPQPEQQSHVTGDATYGETVPTKVSDLKTEEPFSTLFPIREKTVEAIAEDMRAHGYDRAKPVTVWAGRGVVIDGHTRLAAAKRAGLTEIPVVFRKFDGEDEALEYAIHEQRNRRNLTDADIIRFVAALDKRRSRGRNHRAEEAREEIASSEVYKTSAAETAKRIGVSKTRVENARAVSDSNDAALKEAVATGQMSLHKAAVKARAATRRVKLPDHVKVAVKIAAALNTHTAELRSCGNSYKWACDILADVSARLQEAAKAQGTGTAA